MRTETSSRILERVAILSDELRGIRRALEMQFLISALANDDMKHERQEATWDVIDKAIQDVLEEWEWK